MRKDYNEIERNMEEEKMINEDRLLQTAKTVAIQTKDFKKAIIVATVLEIISDSIEEDNK